MSKEKCLIEASEAGTIKKEIATSGKKLGGRPAKCERGTGQERKTKLTRHAKYFILSERVVSGAVQDMAAKDDNIGSASRS